MPTHFDSRLDRRSFVNAAGVVGMAAFGSTVPLAAAEMTAAEKANVDLVTEIKSIERARITEALARCGGNQSKAARLLGVSRGTLIARIEEYGLARPLKGDAGRRR